MQFIINRRVNRSLKIQYKLIEIGWNKRSPQIGLRTPCINGLRIYKQNIAFIEHQRVLFSFLSSFLKGLKWSLAREFQGIAGSFQRRFRGLQAFQEDLEKFQNVSGILKGFQGSQGDSGNFNGVVICISWRLRGFQGVSSLGVTGISGNSKDVSGDYRDATKSSTGFQGHFSGSVGVFKISGWFSGVLQCDL